MYAYGLYHSKVSETHTHTLLHPSIILLPLQSHPSISAVICVLCTSLPFALHTLICRPMFDYGCACICVHCVCIDPWWWLRLLVARSCKVKSFETSAQQSIICRGGRGRRVVHFIEHKQRNKSTFWQNVCSLLLVQVVTQPFYLAAEIHGRGCREPCQRKKIHGKTEAIDFLAELLA